MILSGVRPAAMLAVAGAAAAAIAQPAAQPAAGPSDEQACEFRYTEITLNALSGPASREVSEDELAWARQQE